MSTDGVIGVILAVAVTFISMAVLAVVALAYWDFRKNLKALVIATEKLSSLNSDLSKLPELCSGIIRICESLADSTISISKSVDRFHSDIFDNSSRSTSPASSSFQPYSDERASRVFEENAYRGVAMETGGEERFNLGT